MLFRFAPGITPRQICPPSGPRRSSVNEPSVNGACAADLAGRSSRTSRTGMAAAVLHTARVSPRRTRADIHRSDDYEDEVSPFRAIRAPSVRRDTETCRPRPRNCGGLRRTDGSITHVRLQRIDDLDVAAPPGARVRARAGTPPAR